MNEFDEYVKKYAEHRNISEAEARTHNIVYQYRKYLRENVDECKKENQKIQKSIITTACGAAENCES